MGTEVGSVANISRADYEKQLASLRRTGTALKIGERAIGVAQAVDTAVAVVGLWPVTLLTGCPQAVTPPVNPAEGEGEGEEILPGEGEGEIEPNGISIKDVAAKSIVVDPAGNEIIMGSGTFYAGEKPAIGSDLKVPVGFAFPKMANQDTYTLVGGTQAQHIPAGYEDYAKFVTIGLNGACTNKAVLDADDSAVFMNLDSNIVLMPGNGTAWTPMSLQRVADGQPLTPNPAVGTGELGDPTNYINFDVNADGALDAAETAEAQRWFLWAGYAFELNYNNPVDARRIYTQSIDRNWLTNEMATDNAKWVNAYDNGLSSIGFSTDLNGLVPGLVGYKPAATAPVIKFTPMPMQTPGAPANNVLLMLDTLMEPSPTGMPEITGANEADIPYELVSGTPRLYFVNESLAAMPNNLDSGKAGLMYVSPDATGTTHAGSILGISIPQSGAGFVPGAKEFNISTRALDVVVTP